MKYIMAFDAGTTSERCILFDKDGRICAKAQREFTQFFPQSGYVEHDAEEIWLTQYNTAVDAMSAVGASAEDIAAIGITNQRETVVMWDRNTGEPIYHAIVWQDRRTADMCEKLAADGITDMIHDKTGLVIDPYFSATKIRWMLDNVPHARERAERGELLFGTIDTWLIWKLTGGKVHVTDYSNASRTMLFNIHTLEWDKDLLKLMDIPESILPRAEASSCIYGETAPSVFGAAIPVGGAAGDQQAALFGQKCFGYGDVKNTYGTGCFLLMNTGTTAVSSKSGLVTSIAWRIGDKTEYVLEGSVFVGGSVIQWLRDELHIIDSAADSEYFASKVDDTNGCYIVPAFTGLGAPYWDPYARGAIAGLSRGTNKCHIIRAALEAIAFQTYDVLSAMENDIGYRITSLKADGGASANDLLMQMQADIIQADVYRPAVEETTALGAAYLAGLAVGFWDKDSLPDNDTDRCFAPCISAEQRGKRIDEWHKAVTYTYGWTK